METKELIFAGKKFFEGQVPSYIGKHIVGVKQGLMTYSVYLIPNNATFDKRVIPPSNSIIVAQFCNYLGHEGTYVDYIDGKDEYIVKLDDILQNGGVSSSPLTHLYQGLRHLLNRKVAYVFD